MPFRVSRRTKPPSGIRRAYRDAVRRTHPDHAGPEGAPSFQEVVEAHSILSDPLRRRQYDQSLINYEQERSQSGLQHRFKSEPIRDWTFADMHPERPSFDALTSRFLRDTRQAESLRGLSLEVILTPEEAARGGILSIDIPMREVCEVCGGTGYDWLFPCLNCGGEGSMSRIRPLQVRVPRALSLGYTREVSLEVLAINNVFLKLRIRVSKERM